MRCAVDRRLCSGQRPARAVVPHPTLVAPAATPSNCGDALKLQQPSPRRKALGGRVSSPGTVTALEIRGPSAPKPLPRPAPRGRARD